MNLSGLLCKISEQNPHKTALIEEDKELSYAALWDKIEKLSEGFRKIGLKKNDKAAIILPNGKEFIFSFFALLRINAIAVPLKPSFTGFELKRIFQNCNPVAIITTASFFDKVLQSNQELWDGRAIIIHREEGKSPEDSRERIFDFEQLYDMGKDGDIAGLSTENNQIASINYTYRGNGDALGAVLTHENYDHGRCLIVELTKLNPVQKSLLILPAAHIFALVSSVVFPLLGGITVVIIDSFLPRRIFKAIHNHRIDFMVAVPVVYFALSRNYDKEKYDLSSLCWGISGGDFLCLEDSRRIKEAMGINLVQGYGLTECLPVTCNPVSRNKPGSLGPFWHRVEIKIVDDFGQEREVNQIGEIVVGGPSVMQGYYAREKETKEVLRDGWFYTGDYGRLDADGYLYFAGLKKRIAKVGGNTIDLTEVEQTLLSHPAITTAKVHRKPDPLWGHQLTAEVSLDSNREIPERDIKSFCKERLALYKIPRTIMIKNKN